MAYKKCPRCSLNYMEDTDVLCKICLDEVGKALRSNDEEEEYDICPECGEHIIKAGEEMCYQCMIEQNKDDPDLETVKSKDWDNYSENDDNEETSLFEEEEVEEMDDLDSDPDEDSEDEE